MRIVDILVAEEDRRLLLVPVGATIVVVVVVGWVGKDAVEDGLVHLALYLVEIGRAIELLLLGIGETIEADILQGTAATGGGEGIGHGALSRYLAPLGVGEAVAAIHWHAALIELLAVSEDVLAHLAQVDVEVAAIAIGIGLLTAIDEWVEEPELDVLHVGLLEVVGVESAHHATPVLQRVRQGSVLLQVVDIEVVRTTLVRIVGDVHGVHRARLRAVGLSLAQWEELSHIDRSHVVVAQLVVVALDVSWRERASLAIEERVDGVPCHLATVESTRQPRLVLVLREHGWHAGENPRGRCHHVDAGLGALEVVEVGGVVLRAARLSGYQLSELAREGDVGRLREVQEWYLVEHIGEPLALLLPVHVDAPEGVVERLVAHRHLGEQRLLAQVQEGTAQLEVLREVVLPVETEHGLSRHAIVGVALQRHVDRRSGIDDALVEDGHLASIVIHRVVRAFAQRNTTCRHHHGTLRHIDRSERDDIGRGALELSHQEILVLLGYLLRHRLGAVVEFGEGVASGFLIVDALSLQVLVDIASEWLHLRDEDATTRHGVALHIVEVAIAVGIVVVVESIGTEHLDERCLLHLLLRDVGEIDASGIALELDVESELLLLHLRGEVIDVLHHQVPVALLRIVARVLERLHEEALLGVGDVAGELAHLVGHSAIGVFVSHGKHLVGLQLGSQRDISHG